MAITNRKRALGKICTRLDDLKVDLDYALFEQTGDAASIMEQIKELRRERDAIYREQDVRKAAEKS